MVIWMDDAHVFSRSVQEHLQHLSKAALLLCEKQSYIRVHECSFLYVGNQVYRVSSFHAGVQPGPAKTEAIPSGPLHIYTRIYVQ